MQKRKGGDATGWKRGAKGFANSKEDKEFLRTRNPKAAQVEGSDC